MVLRFHKFYPAEHFTTQKIPPYYGFIRYTTRYTTNGAYYGLVPFNFIFRLLHWFYKKYIHLIHHRPDYSNYRRMLFYKERADAWKEEIKGIRVWRERVRKDFDQIKITNKKITDNYLKAYKGIVTFLNFTNLGRFVKNWDNEDEILDVFEKGIKQMKENINTIKELHKIIEKISGNPHSN